jgi:hypothetical protein
MKDLIFTDKNGIMRRIKPSESFYKVGNIIQAIKELKYDVERPKYGNSKFQD